MANSNIHITSSSIPHIERADGLTEYLDIVKLFHKATNDQVISDNAELYAKSNSSIIWMSADNLSFAFNTSGTYGLSLNKGHIIYRTQLLDGYYNDKYTLPVALIQKITGLASEIVEAANSLTGLNHLFKFRKHPVPEIVFVHLTPIYTDNDTKIEFYIPRVWIFATDGPIVFGTENLYVPDSFCLNNSGIFLNTPNLRIMTKSKVGTGHALINVAINLINGNINSVYETLICTGLNNTVTYDDHDNIGLKEPYPEYIGAACNKQFITSRLNPHHTRYEQAMSLLGSKESISPLEYLHTMSCSELKAKSEACKPTKAADVYRPIMTFNEFIASQGFDTESSNYPTVESFLTTYA